MGYQISWLSELSSLSALRALQVLLFDKIVQNVLECGSKKSNADQTMTLYLSKKLGKRRHGFEYAALEVKHHLECLMFSDIVSTAMIMSASTPYFLIVS